MDDYEVERVGSDNPAQSVPAAQRIQPSRQTSSGNVKTGFKRSEDLQKADAPNPSLTKYDVCTPGAPINAFEPNN